MIDFSVYSVSELILISQVPLTHIPQVACRLAARSLFPLADHAILARGGAGMWRNARMQADRIAHSRHSGLAAPFFSAVDRAVLPLSFSFSTGSRSCTWRRGSKAVDRSEDGPDHGAGDRHLGQLEGDGTGVTHDAGPHLDQFQL